MRSFVYAWKGYLSRVGCRDVQMGVVVGVASAAMQKLSILVCWSGARSRSDDEGCIIGRCKHTLERLTVVHYAKPPQITPSPHAHRLSATAVTYLLPSSATRTRWTVLTCLLAHRNSPHSAKSTNTSVAHIVPSTPGYLVLCMVVTCGARA
jgi:hypothetical protein